MKWYVYDEKEKKFVEATCGWGNEPEDKKAALEMRYLGYLVGIRRERKVKDSLVYYLPNGMIVAVDVPEGHTLEEVIG